MQNMWEVIHKLVDGGELSSEEKAEAHRLVDTHLAQHQGIAQHLGEHREKIRALENRDG